VIPKVPSISSLPAWFLDEQREEVATTLLKYSCRHGFS
jgi:hypothetical protein